MAAPIFVDGVTPLNAANFNALGAEVNGKVTLPGGAVTNGQWLKGVGGAVVWAPLASYGTTLPASPLDGDEAVLVDSTTNPSYQWLFRYNAGSSSAYKWEFIGGAAAQAAVEAVENCSSGAWGDLTTVGPTFTLPRAGDYELSLTAASNFVSGAAGVYAQSAIWIGTVSMTGVLGTAPGTNYGDCNCRGRVLGFNAGDVLRQRYVIGSGVYGFARRRITITPIRVS